MESSPRPGYYPDPSIPGYIRYWDGSQWVAGTSKPMPDGDEAPAVEAAPPPPPRTMAAPAPTIAFPQQPVAAEGAQAPFQSSAPPFMAQDGPDPEPQAARPPFPAQEPAVPPFMSQGASAPAPEQPAAQPPFVPQQPPFQAQDRQPAAPFAMPVPPAMSFDPVAPPAPQPAPQPVMSFDPAPQPAPQPVMSFDPVVPPPPAPVPQPAASAEAQSYRIRLRMPDGKPFDGPEITTGPAASTPWDEQTPAGSGLTMVPPPPSMSAPWGGEPGARKAAPKVVVKAGPAARAGHVLAVLAVSALGVLPLAYLMLNAIHDHEDKVAETITVPTKVNVIDGTAGAYLGGMAVVLLVVALGYRSFLKRRRG